MKRLFRTWRALNSYQAPWSIKVIAAVARMSLTHSGAITRGTLSCLRSIEHLRIVSLLHSRQLSRMMISDEISKSSVKRKAEVRLLLLSHLRSEIKTSRQHKRKWLSQRLRRATPPNLVVKGRDSSHKSRRVSSPWNWPQENPFSSVLSQKSSTLKRNARALRKRLRKFRNLPLPKFYKEGSRLRRSRCKISTCQRHL